MLLDLDKATLTVFVNGERKGVMVQPGMTAESWDGHDEGEPVARLEGPLRWAVDVETSSKVRIRRPRLPSQEAHLRHITDEKVE